MLLRILAVAAFLAGSTPAVAQLTSEQGGTNCSGPVTKSQLSTFAARSNRAGDTECVITDALNSQDCDPTASTGSAIAKCVITSGTNNTWQSIGSEVTAGVSSVTGGTDITCTPTSGDVTCNADGTLARDTEVPSLEQDPAACTNAACTVSLANDTVTGGTQNRCARFDGSGNLVSAGGDCSSGDTDTTCLDTGVNCLFAGASAEGGAATSAAALENDALDSMAEIATTLKVRADDTDTKLLTTSISPPASNTCLEIDSNGSVVLASAACGTGGGGAPGTDTVGTDELDDGANSPTAGYAVIVDSGTTAFEYVDPATQAELNTHTGQDANTAHGETDPDACSNTNCTVDITGDTVTGGTASRCARFDGSGNLVAAGGDCSSGDTTIANTTCDTDTCTLDDDTIVLLDADGAAPTTDGEIKYDRTSERIEVGDGNGTVEFYSGAHTVDTDTTCLDAGVTCNFAGSSSEGGAATSAAGLEADALDAMTEIATSLKVRADDTDTKLLTTSISAPGSTTCLEMDTNGSVVLSSGACGVAGSVGTDVVGTDELDDGANTPTAGYAVIVDSGATAFEYVDPATQAELNTHTGQNANVAHGEIDPDACTNANCTVDLSGDTVTGGTASRCARFDGSGNLVAASGDCSAGDTDTTLSGSAAGGDLSGTYPNPSVNNDSHNHGDTTVDNNLTIAGGTIGTSAITLNAGTAPTTDGLIEWDTTDDRIKVGNDGNATLEFYPGAHTVDTTLAGTSAGGDLTGTYPNPTIAGDAVALGTDTTGNYVATVAPGAGSKVTVTGSGSEGAAVTLGLSTLTIGTDTTAELDPDACSNANCTVDITGDTVTGGTASRCARFDGSGNLVAAGGDCSSGDTTIANTTCDSDTCTLDDDTIVLLDANGAAPTTDGEIKYDRTTERIEVGDGSGTVEFYSGSHTVDTTCLDGSVNCLFAASSTEGGAATTAILASTVTVADIGGDTTSFVALTTDATGSLSVDTDAGITYNATSNVLTATGFAGNLTGTADFADRLSLDPSDCAAGEFANAIDKEGDLTCATVGLDTLSDVNITGPLQNRDVLIYDSTATEWVDRPLVEADISDLSHFTNSDETDPVFSAETSLSALETRIGTTLVPTSQKGAANGVASLDGSAKVPVSQLPDSVVGSVKFAGTWNANTNSPNLTTTGCQSSPGDEGNYYVVSTAGSTNLDGETQWEVGDWAICEDDGGLAWARVGAGSRVTSVHGRVGAVTANTSDYDADQVDNTPAGNIAATDVQAALNELDSEKLGATAAAGGDLTGNYPNPTITADAVALGTDTTGNYVATIADAGNGKVTVANSGTETAAVTLDIADVFVLNTGDTIDGTTSTNLTITGGSSQGATDLLTVEQDNGTDVFSVSTSTVAVDKGTFSVYQDSAAANAFVLQRDSFLSSQEMMVLNGASAGKVAADDDNFYISYRFEDDSPALTTVARHYVAQTDATANSSDSEMWWQIIDDETFVVPFQIDNPASSAPQVQSHVQFVVDTVTGDNAVQLPNGSISDAETANDLTIAGGTIGTSDITLKAGTAPTVDGRIEWDSTTETIKVGDDDTATLEFHSGAHFTNGDETDPVFSAVDTEAELESHLTDVTNVFTNNDGALDDDDLTDDTIGTLSDVTVTGPLASGDVLIHNGSAFVDRPLTAADIASGTLAHERGGLEADVSAYNGLVRISGGTTTNITDLSGLNTALGSNIADGAHNADQNLFETFATPSGTSPVADSTTDTLTFAAGTGITISGDSGTDTITLTPTLGDSISASEMANEDHGDVAWSGGTAEVQSMTTSAIGADTTVSIAMFGDPSGTVQTIHTDPGLVYDATNNVLTATDHVTVGDTEYQMTVNGNATTSRLAIATDDGETTVAEIEAHRHEDSVPGRGAVMYGGRSRGSIATPAAVQSGDRLLTIYALGHDGTDEAISAEIDFTVGNTPGNNDMPGTIEFKTSADGSQVPTTRLTIDEDGLATFANNVTVSGTITGSLSGNATTASTANAGDSPTDFFSAGAIVAQDDKAVTDLEGTGLSITSGTLNASARIVERFTPANNATTVTLANTPTAATAVSCAMTGYTLSPVASGPSTGQFSVSGTTVTLGLAVKSGDEVVCTYTYS